MPYKIQHAFCFCVLVLKMLLLPPAGSCQGFLHASGPRIVNGNGENVLLRGIGLGGWMLQEGYMLKVSGIGQQQHSIKSHIEDLVGKEMTEQFYEAWLNNHTTRQDIEALKKWGFNSVRLPMHYNLFTLPVEEEKVPGGQTWVKKGFELTDSLLSWCRDNQLYLILDLHAAPGGQGNDLNIADGDTSKPFLWESQANYGKTVALWKTLALRYRDEPWVGAYDILNEPNWGFGDPENDRNGLKEQENGPLKALMMEITDAIRSVDKNHLIIIEGNGWGNNYNGILPPWDGNMALSFHKYWNFNDQASIQRFLDLREKYQLPVWLGETGENSNVWFTEAIKLVEAYNIGWCWWPLKKIGINNPLEIPSNPDYDKVLAYWKGAGKRPAKSTTFAGLMKLAGQTNFRNNIVHYDVLDAMLRQPGSGVARPFGKNQVGDGLLLPAAHYDLGGQGTAYYDTDSADYHISNNQRGGNLGRAFRNDGVDIGQSGDGYMVTGIEAGEWLQYTLEVAREGRYRLEFTVAAAGSGGELLVTIPEQNFFEKVSVPRTGGDTTWRVVPCSSPIVLGRGRSILRLKFPTGGFNFKFIRLSRVE